MGTDKRTRRGSGLNPNLPDLGGEVIGRVVRDQPEERRGTLGRVVLEASKPDGKSLGRVLREDLGPSAHAFGRVVHECPEDGA